MKKWQKILLILFAIIVLMFGLTLVRFATSTRPAEEIALNALQSNESVIVEENDWVSFSPVGQTPTTGFIFYPGGSVAYEAYAPTLNAIAAQGFLVVDVPMPFSLAVFGINKAADVIAAYPEIEHWVIGGHSLGGSMAARFISGNPGMVEGIVMWASYPSDSDPLQNAGIRALSIYGTLDGLATPKNIANSMAVMPADTIWAPIEGGNHAQFGFYGPQNGDNPAEISRDEQQAKIVTTTVRFLQLFGE